jgi:hypothetical protein
VTIEDKNRFLLDRGGNFEIKEDMDRCKSHLNMLQVDEEMNEELVQKIAPDCCSAVRKSLYKLGNPLQSLRRMHALIGDLCKQLEIFVVRSIELAGNELSIPPSPFYPGKVPHRVVAVMVDEDGAEKGQLPKLHLSETFELMLERWEKLNKEFFSTKTEMFDLTKVGNAIRYR